MKKYRIENFMGTPGAGVSISVTSTFMGRLGAGRQFTPISENCVVSLINGDVEFTKGCCSIVLTKQELINEFKVGLEKGYFSKEDLFPENKK